MSARTDRELLELAAKAVGMQLGTCAFEWDDDAQAFYRHEPDASDISGPWNPLTDDGDALRLAVKLRLHIKPGKHLGDGCTVDTQRAGIAGATAFYDDKAEQMRRAIVLVAANIGEAM